MNACKSLFSALILFLALTTSVRAQETLVISNTDTGNAQNITSWNATQTFTMPSDGELAKVQLFVLGGAGATMTYDLCTTVPSGSDPAGEPDISTPIYTSSVVLPAGSGFQWVDLDLSASNHAALAGENLAIRVHSMSGVFLDGEVNVPDPYAEGGLWLDNSGAPGYFNNKDLVFRVYTRTAVVSTTQPYFEDFESGARGWIANSYPWELGTPSKNFINQAFSGTNCWVTGLMLNYPNSSNVSLTSGWFDFSSLDRDPVISFAYTAKLQATNDGFKLEMNFEDGVGWRTVGDSDWYTAERIGTGGMDGEFWAGASVPWNVIRNSLSLAAGKPRVRLRFRFKSDGSYRSQGVAIDDIRIFAPEISVTDTEPYFEDFEKPGDGWAFNIQGTFNGSGGPVWERGTPTTPNLGAPYSGVSCWATTLDSFYPTEIIGRLISPPIDCSTTTTDPVLEFALRHDFHTTAGGDGLRVEVDLDDGNGFQTLGTLADWYDGTLSGTNTAGGIGWTGQSNGWRILRHPITGAAGRDAVSVRFIMNSNHVGSAEGALVDDVRIFVPTFAGTETSSADDIRMQVYINSEREVGQADAYTVQAGEQVEVFGISPEGSLVGGEYYLVGEVFATGATYTNVASDVWISLGVGTVLLQGGVQPPFYVPMQMGPFGLSHYYFYGGGAAGFSCRVQAIIFLPTAANGLYASSDAFELKFN